MSENIKIIDGFYLSAYLKNGWQVVQYLGSNEYLINLPQLPKGVNQ